MSGITIICYIFLIVEIVLMSYGIMKDGANRKTTFHLLVMSLIFWILVIGFIVTSFF